MPSTDNKAVTIHHRWTDLAGVPLTFAMEIIEIRPASPEEIAHGPGRHHH